MRKSFRKSLIYLILTMLIMPTWLVTGMLKTPKVQAAESGLKNGTVFTDVPGIGNDPWSNPSMAQLSDNQYATATISGSNNRTHYLKSTGFNFNIPNGTLIKGIELKLEKHQECTSGTCTSNVTDSTVSLVKNGLVTGSNLAESTSWGTSDSTSTYGGATNLWGSVWTNSDINNVNFGSVISATRNSGRDRTVSIDSVTMKVYYDDISAPVIETHSNVLAEATSMSGAVVNYTAPNTNDNVDGVSPAVCSPASGSTFVLGMTTVNCTKEDIAGNDAIPTFFFVNVQDTVKPVVTGVQSGWHYNHSVTPTFSDATTITALLNGVPFTSGTTVSEVGSYDLIVADLFGNSTGINFWINPLSQTTEINTVPQDVVSIDGNLKVIGIQTNSGLGTITIEKYNGEPKKEGSTIGANGFYYNITTTGDIKFPIQIELSYSDATSESNYLDETKFVSLYYFDGTNWKDYQLDIDPSSVSLDKENNKIIASLKHLTPIVPVIDVSAPDSPVLTSKIVIGKTIKLDWNRVDGAKFYYVYVSNQAISESQYIRKDVIADPATHDEINVGAYGNYYVVVTAEDAYGNVSIIPTASNQTIIAVTAPATSTPVVTVKQAPKTTSIAPSSAQAATTTTPSTTTPEVTTNSNTNGDDEGEIKGDESADETEKINWTPWIVLFVLIVLAGAATGGYFYWFAGEDEVRAVVKEPKKVQSEKVVTTVKSKQNSNTQNKKSKRW